MKPTDGKPSHSEISEAFKSELQARGLTVAELARRSDTPYETARRIVAGASRGSPQTIDRILDVLQIEQGQGET